MKKLPRHVWAVVDKCAAKYGFLTVYTTRREAIAAASLDADTWGWDYLTITRYVRDDSVKVIKVKAT